MSGFGHPGRRLAGMLRTLSGISVVTCSIGRVGTSFGHRFGLSEYVRHVLQTGRFGETLTRIDGFLKIFNSLLLTTEAGALLVMKPPELLQDLGVGRISIQDSGVRRFGRVVLSES